MTTEALPLAGRVEPAEVHFDDFDPMGIVHNGRYAVLLERALTRYWLSQGWDFDPVRSKLGDVILAVREFAITFHVPISELGEVAVHFWLDKVGNSSIVYGFRILSADHTVVHAEGKRVQVSIDRETGRPKAFNEQLRTAAEPLLRAQTK
ncbi:thioesterase family protein [Phytomonospora sp. NPDC050363]|uniref:acyl-CoA thioesterase n=1 Tax=Phytomonospora sp. NPDC050363 TaxID=3155642 RepID=UPI0033CA0CF3